MKRLIVVAAVALACCTENQDPTVSPSDVEIRVIAGQVVNGTVNATVPNIMFGAVDERGAGVAGILIIWQVTGPGPCPSQCSLKPSQSVTARDGTAAVSVTLGSTSGDYKLIPFTRDPLVVKIDTLVLHAVPAPGT